MIYDLVVVEFDHCSLSWDDGASSTLIDITCSIKAGELVAVVGRVAAGKSSFISAIAGLTISDLCLMQYG
jgi:ABC-type phosphate/phosphonate transport system ATPase subunit